MVSHQRLLRRILVAVDGSPNSRRAAVFAAKLAARCEAEIIVINVISVPLQQQQFSEKIRVGANKIVRTVASMCHSKGLKTSTKILEASSVVEAIVNYAADRKISLIVIGTRGLTGFKKLLIGSVSAGVVSHAPCAVLVVR
jgi:nucleotide-binding universal stress UspA family protein